MEERRFIVKMRSHSRITGFNGRCNRVDYDKPNGVAIFYEYTEDAGYLTLAMIPWSNIEYVENALWDMEKNEVIWE